MSGRLKVLVISERYPKPSLPALGAFVERQVSELKVLCDVEVVCPIRVVPPQRLLRHAAKLAIRSFRVQLVDWLQDVVGTPRRDLADGLRVDYPRYTSQPNQLLYASIGHVAWPLLRGFFGTLRRRFDFDVVHAHDAVPCGTLAMHLGRLTGAPTVLSIHGHDLTYTNRLGRLNRRLLLDVLQSADAICANSRWTSDQLTSLGLPAERVHLIELGAVAVSAEPIAPRASGRLRVLSVGFLVARKKFDVTIRALAAAVDSGADLELSIVGDGPERERLAALIDELNVRHRVELIGYAHPDDIAEHYDRADIFALPSVDEAFGLVYVEALARGVPPIGCRGEGGPTDLAARGDCIRLVEPNSVAALAEALVELARSPDLRRSMAETGREIVRRTYSWQRNATRTVSLYDRLLHQRHVVTSQDPSRA